MMTIETVVKILEESLGVWVAVGMGVAAGGETGTAYCAGLGALGTAYCAAPETVETDGWKEAPMGSKGSVAGCCE